MGARPLVGGIADQLLEQRKPEFAVVECVAQLAVAEYPGRRDPGDRQAEERRHLVVGIPRRVGMEEEFEVFLRTDAILLEHGAPILRVPHGYKNEVHVEVGIEECAPAVVLQLGGAVGAPGRPEMHHGYLRRLHCFGDLLFDGQPDGGIGARERGE